MNSMIIKKSVFNLVLCVVTAVTLTSCSSQSRSPAAEEQAVIDSKEGSSAIPVDENSPQRFHSKRITPYNEYN